MDTKQILSMQQAAKKLWGEEILVNPYTIPKEDRGGKFTGNAFQVVTTRGWKRHLADLVTSDDPATYLKENS